MHNKLEATLRSLLYKNVLAEESILPVQISWSTFEFSCSKKEKIYRIMPSTWLIKRNLRIIEVYRRTQWAEKDTFWSIQNFGSAAIEVAIEPMINLFLPKMFEIKCQKHAILLNSWKRSFWDYDSSQKRRWKPIWQKISKYKWSSITTLSLVIKWKVTNPLNLLNLSHLYKTFSHFSQR